MSADYYDICPNCKRTQLAVYEEFEIDWNTMTIRGNVYAECRNCFIKLRMFVREEQT